MTGGGGLRPISVVTPAQAGVHGRISFVTPAQAGVQGTHFIRHPGAGRGPWTHLIRHPGAGRGPWAIAQIFWIPASAGMTGGSGLRRDVFVTPAQAGLASE